MRVLVFGGELDACAPPNPAGTSPATTSAHDGFAPSYSATRANTAFCSRRPCGGAPLSLARVLVSVVTSSTRAPHQTPRGQAPRLHPRMTDSRRANRPPERTPHSVVAALVAAPHYRSRECLCPW